MTDAKIPLRPMEELEDYEGDKIIAFFRAGGVATYCRDLGSENPWGGLSYADLGGWLPGDIFEAPPKPVYVYWGDEVKWSEFGDDLCQVIGPDSVRPDNLGLYIRSMGCTPAFARFDELTYKGRPVAGFKFGRRGDDDAS